MTLLDMLEVLIVLTGLNFTCKVNGCPRIFKNTNSWYKHVRSQHKEEYLSRSLEPSLPADTDEHTQDSAEGDDNCTDGPHNDPLPTDTLMEHFDFDQGELQPGFVSKDVVGAMMLKLKDKHKLSNSAIEEAIQLTDVVANHVVKDTLRLIEQNANAQGMNTNTSFFINLPKIAENVSNPLAALETIYKQRMYVTKNFPYVVCQ